MNKRNINEMLRKAGKSDKPFNLNYAARTGTFSFHAGEDFLDQIRFIHDLGFKSIEDSLMMGRPMEEQEKVGNLLDKLGMQMGVFVVGRGIGKGLEDALLHGGHNWRPSLATGKKEYRDDFLNTCH